MLQLKPLKEILAMSKEKLDEVLAGPRARKAKAQADSKMADIESEMITIEGEVHELCATKDISFDSITAKMDKYDLLERRKKQLQKILKDLFPEGA